MPSPTPKPAPKAAPAPKLTQHNPVPKAKNTLKPLLVGVKPDAPAPSKRSPATPNLNARVGARRHAAREQAEKPKPYVSAEQVRRLPANHPARLAYTVAAHAGPAAATAAFHAAMQLAA